jgi:hypothetical protein
MKLSGWFCGKHLHRLLEYSAGRKPRCSECRGGGKLDELFAELRRHHRYRRLRDIPVDGEVRPLVIYSLRNGTVVQRRKLRRSGRVPAAVAAHCNMGIQQGA